MKRKIFLLLSIFFCSFALQANDDDDDDTITLNCGNIELNNFQVPVFHGHIEPDATLTIIANRTTTFTVIVLNMNNEELNYRGTTVNGVFHFTRPFPEGSYRIVVENGGNNYTGQFEIH